MKKKFLALVLTLAMVLSLAPVGALAVDESTQDTPANNDVITYRAGTPQTDYPDGLTTLNKQAEKIPGKDNQYKVTLTVGMSQKTETVVTSQEAATVLVIDISNSMGCTKKEHKHKKECYKTEKIKCTAESNPEHWVSYKDFLGYDHLRHKDERDSFQSECEKSWNGNYYYDGETKLICGEEEHFYNDNCHTRLTDAKDAARAFVETYAGTQEGRGRDLSIVLFNYNPSVKLDWTDVSTANGKTQALETIQDITLGKYEDGGTNLKGGLYTAGEKLRDTAVADLARDNKNVIVLTDGAPTQRTLLGGSAGSADLNEKTANEATNLKEQANIYTICFGAAGDYTYTSYWGNGPTVGDFLRDSIATDSSHAYNADNAGQLNNAFKKISENITSGLSAGTVHDALPKGVSSAAFGENMEADWNLSEEGGFTCNKTTNEETGRTDYTYTKTYAVTIDPEKIVTSKLKNGYYPLNDRTTLTVKTGDTNTVLDFPIPAGKVTATITFKSEEGGTIGEKQTEISNSYASGSDFPTIPATTANDGYTFDGWYGKDNNKVETFPATVTGSATYTAKWTRNLTPPVLDSTDVYVYFQTQNTKGEPVDISGTSIQYNGHSWATLGKISTTQTLTSDETYTGENDTLKVVGEQAKVNLKDDALYPGNKDIAAKVLPSITWVSLKQYSGADDYQPATVKCWHLDGKLTVYGVTYLPGVKAGTEVTNMPENPQTYYLKDTIYTVSSNVPQRDGYTFAGWKSSEGGTVYKTGGDMQFTMPNKDVTLTAQWTPNDGTQYKVEHYQQNLEDDSYTLADEEKTTGTTGATVTADVKSYPGFTYDADNTENVVSGEVTADGTLVLKLYYTRNSYKVSYKLNDIPYSTEKTYKYGATVTKEENPTIPEGNSFSGWAVKTEGVNFDNAGQFTMPAKDVIVVGTYAANRHTYTIKGHLRDADGKDIESPEFDLGNGSQVYGLELSTLITETMKKQRTEAGKNYVYVPSETTVTANGGTSKLATTSKLTANDTVINLYYYLDETGKTGKDSEGKDTDTPNGQPDAWECKVTFIVKNGQWDTNPTGGSDTIVKYLTTKDIATGKSIQATLSKVPTAGNTPDSHYKAGSWDPKPNEGDVITKDMTYTYTYSWRSSGGSGGSNRPKPPVVEIPDDVPTGLNGKDHYAYVVGYPDGMVYPQKNITRAEVATIFFRLLTDETREANMTKSNSYNDMKDGAWYTCAVSTLSKMGIIKGYEDGSFKPDASISRAEFAAIAARFDPDGDKTPATFSDVSSHWAKDEISIAANHGWIKGYEDGSFKPDQKITRAETMTLVNRVLKRLPETKDDLHKDMKTWPDNQNESAWFYLAVQEATNSHYQNLKKDGTHEKWESMRETRDWAALEK